MSLLSEVADYLDTAEVAFAVIGATALAVHGASRSTLDVDVLTTDQRILREAFWAKAPLTDAEIDIRWGDVSDPLVGIVQVSRPHDRPVDIIVGAAPWQTRLLEEATVHTIHGAATPVVDRVGLILLKLYAGGPQDRWDITQLLQAHGAEALAPRVAARLDRLPKHCRSLWEQILSTMER
jgi:hypothetical protein